MQPQDLDRLATWIGEKGTAEDQHALAKSDGKNPAAVLLGRIGGRKGGPARAKRLSSERRKEIARKAAKARWGTKDD